MEICFMPAHRSRTTGWRRCLQQLVDHKGSLTNSPRSKHGSTGRDFVWRAKLISMNENEILVEMPTAAGEPLPLVEGVQLLGIIAIGQNRWMFRTKCVWEHDIQSKWTRWNWIEITNANHCGTVSAPS